MLLAAQALRDQKLPIPDRVMLGRAWLAYAEFYYPKRKAIEVTEAVAVGEKQPLGEWLQEQLELQAEAEEAKSSAPGDPGNISLSPLNAGSTSTSVPGIRATPGQSGAENLKPLPTKPSSPLN